ncbi:deoxyuridine 5'-triphosphate nucleotidohydrolase [Alphaproteobacteria bacterium]|nr:deoxyuridine 5'-triphosphate nucleotidohydrolase [Alphaproteobacteria bacterium]
MIIKFYRLNSAVQVPIRGTEESAGYDLSACLDENFCLKPHEISIIGTGLALEIPSGFFGMICPRSGLAAKHGISILNAPGIIDSDYRGEIKCILINFSENEFVIEDKMRIAQLIICKHENCSFLEKSLNNSERGENGFGSTGLK